MDIAKGSVDFAKQGRALMAQICAPPAPSLALCGPLSPRRSPRLAPCCALHGAIERLGPIRRLGMVLAGCLGHDEDRLCAETEIIAPASDMLTRRPALPQGRYGVTIQCRLTGSHSAPITQTLTVAGIADVSVASNPCFTKLIRPHSASPRVFRHHCNQGCHATHATIGLLYRGLTHGTVSAYK